MHFWSSIRRIFYACGNKHLKIWAEKGVACAFTRWVGANISLILAPGVRQSSRGSLCLVKMQRTDQSFYSLSLPFPSPSHLCSITHCIASPKVQHVDVPNRQGALRETAPSCYLPLLPIPQGAGQVSQTTVSLDFQPRYNRTTWPHFLREKTCRERQRWRDRSSRSSHGEAS